jgi:hypothetical protein
MQGRWPRCAGAGAGLHLQLSAPPGGGALQQQAGRRPGRRRQRPAALGLNSQWCWVACIQGRQSQVVHPAPSSSRRIMGTATTQPPQPAHSRPRRHQDGAAQPLHNIITVMPYYPGTDALQARSGLQARRLWWWWAAAPATTASCSGAVRSGTPALMPAVMPAPGRAGGTHPARTTGGAASAILHVTPCRAALHTRELPPQIAPRYCC